MSNDTPAGYMALEASIEAARESAHLIAQNINTSDTYTDAGKNEKYEKYTAEHRDHYEQLTHQITEIVNEAEHAVDALHSEIMPTAQGDVANLAAQIEADRILNRPGMDDQRMILEWVPKTEASPSRTIVLNELVERGLIKADVLDRLLAQTHPEYADAHRRWNQARTAGQIMQQRMDNFKAQLDNRHTQAPDKHTPQASVNMVRGLPNSTVKVTPWQRTQAENAYRQNF